MVRCSSTDLVTCDVEVEVVARWLLLLLELNLSCCWTGEAEAAERNRWRDSLKLGPDSMALSSPLLSEEK